MPKRAKGEYDDRIAQMLDWMKSHAEEDSENFKTLAAQILEVNNDVKSLLSSRSFLRGAWFAVGVFGTLVAAVVSSVIAWFK